MTTTITSSQLQLVLETNAKAIEVYCEVSGQYETAIKLLEEIKENGTSDEKNIEKLSNLTTKLEEVLKRGHDELIEKNDTVLLQIDKLHSIVGKQNIILISTVCAVILGIIGKILGIHIPVP